MSNTLSNIGDTIAANGGIILLFSIILALIALALAAYALILTLRVRSELKRYAAARLTDTKEFLTTISDLSDRLDKPE